MNTKNKPFKEISSFSVNDKKSQTVLSVLFLLLAGFGVGLIVLTKAYTNNTVPVWVIVLSVISFILVHELIHILFMTVFSKGKVNLKVKFPTIAVGSDAYFNKIEYIIIALAPVVVLGIGSLILLLILPYKLLFAIMLTLNFATASGDYILTYYALKQEKNTYFVDKADNTSVYMQEN